jgi:cell division topological specificity factor
MRLFRFLRGSGNSGSGASRSADAAKERLQITLQHERTDRWSTDYLPVLQQEILKAIEKHLPVDGDKVQVNLQRNGERSKLEVNVELPHVRDLGSHTRRGAMAVSASTP